jgi:hypothetical protein
MKRRIEATPALIILFLIATNLLSIAGLLKNQNISTILIGIATSCIAAFILAILYIGTGGEPLQKQIREIEQQIAKLPRVMALMESGLYAVFHERHLSRDNEFWKEEFLNSKESKDFDAIGQVLHDIVESLSHDLDTWKEKVNQGSNVRILILKPDGDETKIRMNHEEGLPGSMIGKTDLSALEQVITKILEGTKDGKGSFSLGFYDIIPYCNIVKVGEKMLVTNYLYRLTGAFSPTYLIEKTKDKKLFEKYMEHFENVWKSGKVEVYKLNDSGEVELASV